MLILDRYVHTAELFRGLFVHCRTNICEVVVLLLRRLIEAGA